MADYTFTRQERLKSKKLIQRLFKEGRSLFQFPIKIVYLPLPDDTAGITNTQFAISVPKKRFKKAVDRNRIKRLMREGIRHHKDVLSQDPPYIMMIIYVANEEISHKIINASIKKLLFKLHKAASVD